jgi:hypothetical protein
MLLFKPEAVEGILAGRKTQTRRLGKKRWNVGAIHKFYTKPPFAKGGSKPFASARILEVREETLCLVSYEDAVAEDYAGIHAFLLAFYEINKTKYTKDNLNAPVWVITFEVVKP